MDRRRAPALPAVLGLVLLLAGCGSRLSQSELVALNHAATVTVAQDTGATTDAGVPEPAAGAPAATGIAAPVASSVVPTATAGPTATSAGSGKGRGSANTGIGGATADRATHAAGSVARSALQTDNKPLTVCSVSELGGPAGAAFAQGVPGLQAWLGDVNAHGGVAGHQIRLVVKDSGSDPNVALADARSCVENDGAVALVGSMSPLSNRGFQSYLESKGVPAIGGDCGSSTWNDSPVFFNQCPAVETNYWYLAYEAAHAGAANNKLAFLYCQEAQTCAEGKKWWIEQNFPKQNGLDLVYSKQFSLTQLDFTSECAAMKAAGATLVMAVVDPSGLQRMGQSCARQGYNPIWSQPYASVYPDTPTKPGLGNIVLGMPVMPFGGVTGKDADNPVYQRYLTAYQRYGDGKSPGPSAVIGYTAGLLFERFLTQVARTTPTVTPAALLAAAGGIKNDSLGGALAPVSFTPGHDTPDSKCWFVMVARNGGEFTAPNGLRQSCRK